MRLPYLALTLLLIFNIGIDVYIYAALRRCLKSRVWCWAQAVTAALLTVMFAVILCLPVRSADNAVMVAMMWMIYVYGSVCLSKILFVVIDLVARIPQLSGRPRLKWITRTGAVMAAAGLATMWWGALLNRLSLDTVEVTFSSRELPEAFDGFRIAQISDMHLATYGSDTTFVHRIVERVNALSPDMIVFTGDLVSRNATEAEPFRRTLAGLHAPCGVFSVLGIHDYGDYQDWPSAEAKAADHRRLIDIERGAGWKLLQDSSAYVERGGDTLVVIGVENIGRPPFAAYGNLKRAYPTPGDSRFKVLLSHDPSHWQYELAGSDSANVQLTLSGHTHAMQIRVMDASPASLIHKYWSGLYTDRSGRALYVNIGTGTVGYPARIGATPEITLITLRREKQ